MRKSWATVIKEAILEAGREHIRNKTDYNLPIDIFSIIESNNIVLMFQPLGALAGAYLPGEKKRGTPAGILINENLPITKQRYSAAHEYCHFLRKDSGSLDTQVDMFDLTKYKNDDAERIAESFASRFLMPRPLITNMMKKLGIDSKELNAVNVYALSLRLGTSYSATVNQLYSLKFITDQKKRQLTIPPKTIKEQLGNNGLETNWNDIWQVVKNDHGNYLSPKQGDILKIHLEENPASGYTWISSYNQGLDVIEDKWHPYNGVGSGGQKHLTIKLTQPGLTNFELRYSRPWRRDEIIDSLKVNLQIESKRHGVNEALLTG